MIYLGIDSGTQSTKTIALDFETGEILASAQAFYKLIDGLPPGHMEQDPSDWIQAVKTTVLRCISDLGDRRAEIRAIAVSGQQHGLVALNRNNEPIRPAKLWCDTSTAPQCAQIHEHFGGARGVIELTGNAMLPGYTAPKILWLKQNEPENFAQTRTILLPHDYINFWLTGARRMEFGDASGTALLDVRDRAWVKEILEFIDPSLEDKLPPVQSSLLPVGLLRDTLRAEWGLPEPPLVAAGGGDNMMGAIGTGNTRPGVFTASLGTSGTLYAFSQTPVIDEEGEVAAFCDGTDHWLPLVCTMNVTVATEQIRLLFGWDIPKLEASIAAAPPGADGILFLPYLTGERTPDLPDGTGVLHGLTTRNMSPPNIARATVEGVTLGLAYGLRRFRDLDVQPQEIRLTGGGSRSAIWRQIAADAFGCPTVCLASSEGAALGAALQAAIVHHAAIGQPIEIDGVTEKHVRLEESTRATPDPGRAELYAQLLRRQTELTRFLHAKDYL